MPNVVVTTVKNTFVELIDMGIQPPILKRCASAPAELVTLSFSDPAEQEDMEIDDIIGEETASPREEPPIPFQEVLDFTDIGPNDILEPKLSDPTEQERP